MNFENLFRVDIYDSPLGYLLMESDGRYLTGLKFFDDSVDGIDKNPQRNSINDNYSEIFDGTKRWLDVYFSGECPNFILPVHLSGTGFQKCVYEVLLTIPFGKVMTYGDLAKKVAKKRGMTKMSAQAVGHANSLNPIGIIVPCHRVVGSDGKLVGYAGGLDKKAELLRNEGVDIDNLDKFRVRIGED